MTGQVGADRNVDVSWSSSEIHKGRLSEVSAEFVT